MDRKPLTGPDASFLARWSRRKRGLGEDGGPALAEATPATATPDEAADVAALSDADMPPIESLGEDDDYSGFFSEGVSEALRRAALQRLFRSPKFNVTDGLDDYAEDFTRFTPLGEMITADMKHHMQRLIDKAVGGEEGDGAAQAERTSPEDPPAEDAAGGAADGQESTVGGEPPEGERR